MTLPEIAAEARRMAERYRAEARHLETEPGDGTLVVAEAAMDFDRLAALCEMQSININDPSVYERIAAAKGTGSAL
ncbi:MAG: hypothetical protein AB7P12_09885 [Alphaproteobacteria bacterium]